MQHATRVNRYAMFRLCLTCVVGVFAAPILLQAADDEKPASTTVTGQVLNESGEPIAGATVRLPYSFVDGENVTTTDKEGRFELQVNAGYPPNAFTCLASSDDGMQQGYSDLDFKRAELPRDVTITLKPARELPVLVHDAKSHPVAEAEVLPIFWVFAFDKVLTDESGQAVLRVPAGLTIRGVFAGKPDVGIDYFRFDESQLNQSQPEFLAEDIEAIPTFQLRPTREVTLRIQDAAGKPLAGATVIHRDFNLIDKGGALQFVGWKPLTQTANAEGIAIFDYIPADNIQKIPFNVSHGSGYEMQIIEFDPYSSIDDVEVTLPLKSN